MTIYFYGAGEAYGCFSNFSAHGITLGEGYWPTTEHYFQAMKFVGTKHVDVVRRAKTPNEAARLGRQRTRPLRADWESVKDNVMRDAVRAKFTQHDDCRRELLETGDAPLVEKTTGDRYWGCGTNGDGKNMLGKILVEIRSDLRANGG